MTAHCVSGHAITFPDFPEHETIWATAGDERGRVHVAVCCELTGGGTVQLFCYETDTGKLFHALDVAAAIGEHPEDGHASHGKIHFALCPAVRLFVMDSDGGNLADLGRISADYPLALVSDGCGHAYTSDTWGYLIRVDLRRRRFDLLDGRLPGPGGATGLARSMSDAVLGPDGYVYAVGYACPNLVRFRPAEVGPIEIEDFGPLAPESNTSFARGLTFGPDGAFCGMDAGGGLYCVSASGEVHRQRESATGGVAATALTALADGRLAAGTADGRLLLVDSATGGATDCGRPNWSPCLRSLIEPGDGTIYGITGHVGDLSRLVRWQPGAGAWDDLGLVHAAHHFPWTAFSIGPLATGTFGELLAGECDRFGHIFIMHPPAPQ